MTRKESGVFLNELISLYPNLVRQSSPVKMLAELWSEALKNEEYSQIRAALIKYFKNDTKGYVPTAGQLIELTKEEPDPFLPPDHEYYPPEVDDV